MATKTAARTAKKSKKASKKLPVCTSKDLRKPKGKRRKCTVPPKKTTTSKTVTTSRPSPAGAVAAPPATSSAPTASPTPWPTTPIQMVTVPPTAVDAPAVSPSPSPESTDVPLPSVEPVLEPVPTQYAEPAAGLAVYSGPFGVAQAQRLLFRAGFGPKPGQAEALAALGVRGAVAKLLNPGTVTLEGPAPTGSYLVGGKFAPEDKYGHTHLDWLDRMVRSTDSLSERMALVFHDWFGLSEANVEKRLAFQHIDSLRKNWRGSFRTLMQDVAASPAMLVFLNRIGSARWAPNENFARELLELYTLGADRGAYGEADVRELSRAFTGWLADYRVDTQFQNFRFVNDRFDAGTKRVFAETANEKSIVTSKEAVDAIIDHSLHPSFFVRKLWSYFIPTEPTAATQAALEAVYRASGERVDAVITAILQHPDLYSGASMTKNPSVFTASLLRARGQGITTDAWVWRMYDAGQLLTQPPSVSGWNDRAWMNTSTFAFRWRLVQAVVTPEGLTPAAYTGVSETPQQAVAAALKYWGNPAISLDHKELLDRIASRPWVAGAVGDPYGSLRSFLASRQNVLRMMVAAAPDFQVA